MTLEKGAKGEEVRSIQEALNFLHFQGRISASSSADFQPLETDGIFGNDTEDAVTRFQEDRGLYTDGRVGLVTIEALQAALSSRNLELSAPLVLPTDNKLTIATRSGDKYGDGYDRIRLRSDVMIAFDQVCDEVHKHGGLITSSGGIRDLYFKVGPNQSATSFHYSGRAHDLMIYSGMMKPDTDPYVVERLGDRRYRVYARCAAKSAASGALPPSTTVRNVVTHKSRVKGVSVTDHLLDLTAVFEKHGFRPIRARKAFEGGGDYLGAEWWHFQYEVGLIRGVTTFGSELSKLYSEAKLKPSPPWKYRDYIFGKDWN
ncbi:hypothetical protein ASF53_16230 [Methylobacterium sp. Leaf123]|uniref:peptidoglycan-binding domain-containing protein n=1 Tax=Methylobacterium sp. Leaf123 TaxID=1736264 RepID=UPI0006F46A43|nr:peptidoglycan-binding domain-containing protein [Methylobacterium sp. Leaf123]KQQ11723.1 hypothetical protein ASF53_16230 [Methylobacterium sp. Leaf123]